MNLQYNKDGKLEFDLRSLLECAKDETRVELIESLSCDEAVIKHVVDQILDGWTESSYHGITEYEASVEPIYSLDRARREIAKRSSELAKQQIEELEKSLKKAENEIRELEQKEWERINIQRRAY